MTALNYPLGGPQETLSYDAMSNLSAISETVCTDWGSSGCNSWTTGQFASATYLNTGQLSSLFEYSGIGSATYSYSYNSLQQMTGMSYTPNAIGGATSQALTYTYGAGQNNGRITQFSDTGTAGTGEVVNYTYDSLNRLIAASTSNGSGPQWGESYAYDGFGNLLSKTPTKGTAPQVSTGVNAATNQMAPSDANGNWLGTNTPQNTWDVENRLISSGLYDGGGNLISYSYDPWGKRIMQYANGGDAGLSTCQIYFYGVNGKRLGTYTCGYNAGQFTAGTRSINQYFGKRLITSGAETGPGAVFTDRLGSVRQGGNGQMAYFPYGEERTSTPDGTDKFGTYFRDGYGQDYAEQRYYTSNYGRFWSVDPKGYRAADSKNPTSWNQYAYVKGDPANLMDRQGADDDDPCGDDPEVVPSRPPNPVSACVSDPGPEPPGPPQAPQNCIQTLDPSFTSNYTVYIMTMRIINENSFWSLGSKSYENGDKAGHPTGPTITWASLALEDQAIASVIMNLANTPYSGYGSVAAAAYQNGDFGNANKIASLSTLYGDPNSPDCWDIQIASADAATFLNGQPPDYFTLPMYYNQWRGTLQGNRVVSATGCMIRINDSIFLNGNNQPCTL
jgi:RHS repeat-associated protein